VDEDISRSDNESGGEKPVREKLRDTSIAGARGRLQKKRSLEEIQGDDDAEEQQKEGARHVRKRSREAVPGADVEIAAPTPNGAREARPATPNASIETTDEEMEVQSGLTSPKNKRTRDQVVEEAKAEDAVADTSTPSEERKTKRARDSGSPQPPTEVSKLASAAEILPTSGFANTSATSPFSSLGARSATTDSNALPQTSDEKFKASGFGAFASASASPFGAASPKAASPFGAPAGSASPWAAKPATPATQPSAFATGGSGSSSGFGNASSTSAFGSLSKSSLGAGFGGTSALSGFKAVQGSSKLGSFAGGSGPTIEGLSSKPAKAFGASDDTDEDEEAHTDEEAAEESGLKSPLHESEGKKDKRFYEQHIETGEEGETTMFQQRAKLYQFVQEEKKWVERGVGVLKLNISGPSEEHTSGNDLEEGKVKLMDAPAEGDEEEEAEEKVKQVHARLLLRADGSQRVVLNSSVKKGLKFGEDKEPSGQTIIFIGRLAGANDGDAGLDLLQLKVRIFVFLL
jgi:Ran-binding protein 3